MSNERYQTARDEINWQSIIDATAKLIVVFTLILFVFLKYLIYRLKKQGIITITPSITPNQTILPNQPQIPQ